MESRCRNWWARGGTVNERRCRRGRSGRSSGKWCRRMNGVQKCTSGGEDGESMRLRTTRQQARISILTMICKILRKCDLRAEYRRMLMHA